jgi:hypothetical protein
MYPTLLFRFKEERRICQLVMAEVLTLFNQSVNLILEARQNIAKLTLDYEEDLICLLSFFIEILFELTIEGFHDHSDPGKERLFLAFEEFHVLIHPLMNHC